MIVLYALVKTVLSNIQWKVTSDLWNNLVKMFLLLYLVKNMKRK